MIPQQQHQRRSWLKLLLIVAGLAAVILLLRFTVWRERPVPVTVHTVQAGRVEDSVVNSRAGAVQSRLRSKMSPGISVWWSTFRCGRAPGSSRVTFFSD